MKFIVSSTGLFSHLQAISRVINSKNSLPILDCFLMELSEKMDVNSLSCTLDIPDVLEYFYKKWVRAEDTLWEQMKASINMSIRDATEIYIRRERMRKTYEKVNINKRPRKKRVAS